MDFIEEIRNLSARIIKQKDVIQTEEATKTALPSCPLSIYWDMTYLEPDRSTVPELRHKKLLLILAQNRAKRLTTLFSKMMKSSCSSSARSTVKICLTFTLRNFTVTFRSLTLELLC